MSEERSIEVMLNESLQRFKCFDGGFYTQKINEASGKIQSYEMIRITNYQKSVKDFYSLLYRLNARKILLDQLPAEKDLKQVEVLRAKVIERRDHLKRKVTKNSPPYLKGLARCEGMAQMMYYNLKSIKNGKDYMSSAAGFKREIDSAKESSALDILRAYDKFSALYDFVGYNFNSFNERENIIYGGLYSTFDLVDAVAKEFGAFRVKKDSLNIIEHAKVVSTNEEQLILKFLSYKPLFDAVFRGHDAYIKMPIEKRIRLHADSGEAFNSIKESGEEVFDLFRFNLLIDKSNFTKIEKIKFTNNSLISILKSFIHQFENVSFTSEYFEKQIGIYLRNAKILLEELQKDRIVIKERSSEILKKINIKIILYKR